MNKECKLGKNIKALLKDCHMSQTELARELDVTAENINRWSNAKSYPQFWNLLELADYFCVSLDEIVYGDVE